MPTSRRLPLLLVCAAIVGALGASSASAASANGSGTVLSLGGHTVRLVDEAHRVGDVHVASTRGLRRGDVVRLQRGRARVSGHARRVSFLGRVVRSSGRGAVVRLGDGSTLKLAGARKPHGRGARTAGNVAIDFRGLAPGETLLITLAADARGNVALAIRALQAGTKVGGGDDDRGGPGDDPACDDEAASEADDVCSDDPGDDGVDEVDGTVTALAGDQSALTVAPDDGSAEQTYQVDDPGLLDDVAVGDEVAVTLDEDGVAIDVEALDWSEDPGPGDDDGGEDE